jgi:hypothetical protein
MSIFSVTGSTGQADFIVMVCGTTADLFSKVAYSSCVTYENGCAAAFSAIFVFAKNAY